MANAELPNNAEPATRTRANSNMLPCGLVGACAWVRLCVCASVPLCLCAAVRLDCARCVVRINWAPCASIVRCAHQLRARVSIVRCASFAFVRIIHVCAAPSLELERHWRRFPVHYGVLELCRSCPRAWHTRHARVHVAAIADAVREEWPQDVGMPAVAAVPKPGIWRAPCGHTTRIHCGHSHEMEPTLFSCSDTAFEQKACRFSYITLVPNFSLHRSALRRIGACANAMHNYANYAQLCPFPNGLLALLHNSCLPICIQTTLLRMHERLAHCYDFLSFVLLFFCSSFALS